MGPQTISRQSDTVSGNMAAKAPVEAKCRRAISTYHDDMANWSGEGWTLMKEPAGCHLWIYYLVCISVISVYVLSFNVMSNRKNWIKSVISWNGLCIRSQIFCKFPDNVKLVIQFHTFIWYWELYFVYRCYCMTNVIYQPDLFLLKSVNLSLLMRSWFKTKIFVNLYLVKIPSCFNYILCSFNQAEMLPWHLIVFAM